MLGRNYKFVLVLSFQTSATKVLSYIDLLLYLHLVQQKFQITKPKSRKTEGKFFLQTRILQNMMTRINMSNTHI